jgi:hypothetical protein
VKGYKKEGKKAMEQKVKGMNVLRKAESEKMVEGGVCIELGGNGLEIVAACN